MNKIKLNPRFIFIAAIILIAAALRLLINIPNVTPIAAMALFGGAYFGKRHIGYIIPLVTLFVSDLVLMWINPEFGFHATMIYVYIGFAIAVTIGIAMKKKVNVYSIFGASLLSSIVFFLLTNFGAWMTQMMPYPMNIAGLMECYTAGLPFLRWEALGTLGFSTVFFGVFYLAQLRFPVLAKVKA
ncbi:MAG: hypothetical protein K9J13_11355 [Saprospiraceae bacterium]|nr:hypothetical protein [Saprospiraceae bacterium]